MITIAGYQIIEQLYESSKSLVYRGCQEREQLPVILKVLRQEYPTPEAVARFRLEYEIIRSLDRAGIVKAYALEKWQHSLVMVLEDGGGVPLNRLLTQRQFSVEEVLHIGLQIVEALEYIHRNNIIHKDINPSNLIAIVETGEIKIIDFGISTILSHGTPALCSPHVLEGTLAYLSPEQTGRMNRSLDYRTDFYSLGVTLYELLSQVRPFRSCDPIELVHCHLAKSPLLLHELKPDIPVTLSQLVMKLMAKMPEERYQSASGVKADLEECLHQLANFGSISPFLLGQQDISAQLQIPQKLYGRQAEVETLLATWDRVIAPHSKIAQPQRGSSAPLQAHCQMEIVLISGSAGVGKTALVQEIHRPVIRQRGYFISGKFDQYQQVPYAGIASAFSELVRQLLTEPDDHLRQWRQQLQLALGDRGQVILEVIPDLELIIGQQPAVATLTAGEAQNRFHLVFQQFVQVFTQPQHPLVLFLDDLQWADAASLNLLQGLASRLKNTALLLIGAYRDTDTAHPYPLTQLLDHFQQNQVPVRYLSLLPLQLDHLTQLLSETLHCSVYQVQSLAQLVFRKTAGNPFFVDEFLRALKGEELLQFDARSRCWHWNLVQIEAKGLTDNVINLLTHRIQQLPLQTQMVLQRAACIGNSFSLDMLAIVCQEPPEWMIVVLHEAVMADLVMPVNDAHTLAGLVSVGAGEDKMKQGAKITGEVQFSPLEAEIAQWDDWLVEYQFIHDRVQQAAYLMIPEDHRNAVHYQIGQLLLEKQTFNPQRAYFFEIVNHLNRGREFIQTETEQLQIAHLNLRAGEKARAAAAYEPAFRYFQAGLSLLPADSWQHQYNLTLDLYQFATEAAYLTGALSQMKTWAKQTLHFAQSPLDRVKVYEVQIQAHAAQTQFRQSLRLALQILSQLGIHFPAQPNSADVELALKETIAYLGQPPLDHLIDLPPVSSPHVLAIMNLLSSAISPSYIAAPEFLPLIVFQQVKLSIQYGNATSSPFAFALCGLIFCGVVLEIETGYQLGQVALRLLNQLEAEPMRAKTLVVVNTNIQIWKTHLRTTLSGLYEAYQAGLCHGDFEFAGYAAVNRSYYAYYAGSELHPLKQDLLQFIQVFTQLNQNRNLDTLKMYLQVVSNLTESLPVPTQLSGNFYVEIDRLPVLQQANDRHALFHFHLHKLVLNYLFEEFELAIQHTDMTASYLDGVVGIALVAVFHFYDSLARLAVYSDQPPQVQESLLKAVIANQEKLAFWATHAPMNYLHKWHLVDAEKYRVLKCDAEAAEAYDRAINLAQEQNYIQDAALACELCARYYFSKKKIVIAKAYLQEARYHYRSWGATSKVRALEVKYPNWLKYPIDRGTPISDTANTSSSSSETLDLATVMKASQAIASDLVLDRLLSNLLRVAIENAGAQIGSLILVKDHLLVVEASLGVEDQAITILPSVPLESSQTIAVAIVNYVARTQTSVVLSNASQDKQFANDPYIVQYQPKSILCTPLVNQGRLVGVLYLENHLISDAFKPVREELLNLLSTQMAIAIENACLLKHQEELNQSLQLEREQMSRILERITDGFIAVDRKGEVIYVNRQAEQKLGRSEQELIGSNLWQIYPDEGNTSFHQHYREALDRGKPVKFEEFYAPSRRWLEVSVYPDQEGLSIFFRDITERRQMEEQLIHDALHDALTGLPNRLFLTQRLEQAIQRTQVELPYRFAILFLDIDRFKVINDSLGHLVGDQLLIAVARRLEVCLGVEDTIARLGGDEFIILLDNPQDEARVAARIQIALNAPFDLNGYKVFNTVSIGIVSSTTGYSQPEELLRAADIAMYQAKAEGKARYVVFDAAMQDQATSLLQLETDLRWAIKRRELQVHYQPIVCLKTGKLAGFEALVRWLHPLQGLISPTKFIPLAEETGLIIPIGQWVFQEACRQLRIWQLQFPAFQHLTMSVNLSVKQFSQSGLIEQIDHTLSNMDLQGHHLKLEITESALMNNPETTRELLQQLRSRQIQLGIDDFGTGYSSLSYLHQFTVDVLKIDRSFVRGICTHSQDAEIVRTILALAKNLAVDVIAEGIETVEQLAELRKLHCGYGQGYFFAPPLNSQDAGELVARSPQW